jgi:Na+-translocating ferredoxin:NAD+ oxidoreductase RnfC subunit
MPQKLSKDHIYSEGKSKGNYRLDEDHLLPSKLQRYKRGESFAERARSTLFNQVDDVLDEVYCDICNGVARSDIVQKLMKTQYESQSGQQKNMTYRTANEYYNCALDRMHFNTDIEHARLKDIFYNRYESLLEAAVKKGDIFNAKGILDSMSKIFLGGDATKNKIEINSKDGQVVIKFGFNDDEDKVEDQDFEEVKDLEN